MKRFLPLLILFIATHAFSQNKVIQLELGGTSTVYSVSYEHQFSIMENKRPFVRAGLGFFSGPDFRHTLIPVEIGLYVGERNNHFEIGLGLNNVLSRTIQPSINSATRNTNSQSDSNAYLFSYRIGYRYQKPEGGFVFRAGFTPVFAHIFVDNESDTTQGDAKLYTQFPWLGISFGYAF